MIMGNSMYPNMMGGGYNQGLLPNMAMMGGGMGGYNQGFGFGGQMNPWGVFQRGSLGLPGGMFGGMGATPRPKPGNSPIGGGMGAMPMPKPGNSPIGGGMGQQPYYGQGTPPGGWGTGNQQMGYLGANQGWNPNYAQNVQDWRSAIVGQQLSPWGGGANQGLQSLGLSGSQFAPYKTGATPMPRPGNAPLPSGYVPAPEGVPFAQNPYLPFGSGYGLGMNFWNSGFGRGPQFPEDLWTRPTPEQSPQSPVTPAPGAGGGSSDRSWQDYVTAYQGSPQYRGWGSDTETAAPTYEGYQNWLDSGGSAGLPGIHVPGYRNVL